jgi:hypothetical protein
MSSFSTATTSGGSTRRMRATFERASSQSFEHQVRSSVDDPEVVQRHDVRVIQPRHGLRLPAESRDAVAAAPSRRCAHYHQRDVATEERVVRPRRRRRSLHVRSPRRGDSTPHAHRVERRGRVLVPTVCRHPQTLQQAVQRAPHPRATISAPTTATSGIEARRPRTGITPRASGSRAPRGRATRRRAPVGHQSGHEALRCHRRYQRTSAWIRTDDRQG